METITLAAYLEKNPESKRLNKRIARALKTYRRSLNELGHAAADIARAKEDCAFATHAADQIIEDCRSLLEEWALPEAAGAAESEAEAAPATSACGEAECKDCCGECDDSSAAREVEDHLRHAAKDIGRALEEAESALGGLDKVEGLLFDIIGMAEADGLAISPAGARAHLLQKAGELDAAEAAAAAGGGTPAQG